MYGSRLFLLVVSATFLFLNGCGNKGPLVLPDKDASSSHSTSDSANHPKQ